MITTDSTPSVHFLTDSLPFSGLGHARRTIALGQALQSLNCKVTYWLLPGSQVDPFEATGFRPFVLPEPADPQFLKQVFTQEQEPLLIIDTYLLHRDFYHELATDLPILPILAFDDNGEKIGLPLLGVINPGLGADQIPYPGRLRPFSAIGPEYVPLPQECLQTGPRLAFPSQIDQASPHNILLVMGASDPERQTERLTRIILNLDESFVLHVVAGPQYGSPDALKSLCASDQRTRLHIAPQDFHGLAASCDLAIVGAGLTVAELLHLGVPVAALVLADNQIPTADALQQRNLGVNLGRFDLESDRELTRKISWAIAMPELLFEMASRGRSLMDGKGSSRLATRVLSAWDRYQGKEYSVPEVISEYRQAFAHPEPYQKVQWGSAEGMENRFALALQILASVQGDTWLDVGSGTGDFFLHAAEKNQVPNNFFGIDITEELTDYAQERCVRYADARFAFSCRDFMQPVPGEPFSLVTCIGVLQKCGFGLNQAVARLAELTAPGGRLLVSTKNLDWKAFDSPECTPCMEHHWFSAVQLRKAFVNAGLKDVWITGYEPRSGCLVSTLDAHSVFILARR